MVMSAAWQYDKGMPCGAAANAAKHLVGEAGFHGCEQAVMSHSGFLCQGIPCRALSARNHDSAHCARRPQLALSFTPRRCLASQSRIDLGSSAGLHPFGARHGLAHLSPFDSRVLVLGPRGSLVSILSRPSIWKSAQLGHVSPEFCANAAPASQICRKTDFCFD